MQPLISVIIPVYKVEKYLHRCIASVINQSYRCLEIFLVDDGSPDNCGDICDEYSKNDKRIKVIHKINGGLSDARNAAIEICKGRYITFVDSDDYVDKDYIKYLYHLIVKYDADISICNLRKVYNYSNFIEKSSYEEKYTAAQALEQMLYQDKFDTWAWGKLYKAELFDKIRFPVGKLYEDLATIYKLILKSNKVSYGSLKKYYYFQREDSIMHQQFLHENMDLIDIVNTMAEVVNAKYPMLYSALCSRCFTTNFFIWLQIQHNGFKVEKKRIKKNIKQYRSIVLFNNRARINARIIAALTYFGMDFAKLIWGTLIKIKAKVLGGRYRII